MKISSVNLKNPINGLKNINMSQLGDIVVLTGANGAGKSRLLKLLEKAIMNNENRDKVEIIFERQSKQFSLEDINSDIVIMNYSHYDAFFQSPQKFTPYVISQTYNEFEKFSFEDTARNGLLFIEYITKYAESNDELKEFNKLLKFLMKEEIDEEKHTLYGFEIGDAKLSPGQQYLLRICIALYFNKIENKNLILFFDELETHLHPDALIKLIYSIKKAFGETQIWISTHSVALLSALDVSDIWHVSNGTCKKLGSKSEPLMKSLIGDELQRIKLQRFVGWPENFACNQFAIECLKKPESVPYKKGDRQISMIIRELIDNSKRSKIMVVDYGAGKGRLLEGIAIEKADILNNIDYYAYDINSDDADICIECMDKNNIDKKNYFNSIDEMLTKINGKVDVVFLVNVLHEIEPKYWREIFENISRLLSDDGYLLLIEHSQLTIGEKPYHSGFVVVQEGAMNLLSNDKSKIICEYHKENHTIARYLIPRQNLINIDDDKIKSILTEIRKTAIEKICEIKSQEMFSFEIGISLAFWTHQLSNIDVIFEKNEI